MITNIDLIFCSICYANKLLRVILVLASGLIMGWKIWQQSGKKLLSCAILTEPFHMLTTTTLSLLLPLSFLFLARLSTAQYLLTFTTYQAPQPSSLLFSLFLYTNPTLIVQLLVSLVSVATLVHGLTSRIRLLSEPTEPVFRPRLYTAWIFVCTLQVCVGLGIEGTIDAGVDGFVYGHERSMLSRVLFFLGLHETMLQWMRTVVKPVVDDTIFGFAREERWVERVVMAASLGTLWWWRLRDEVESMVVVPEVKTQLLIEIGLADFVGWWLYYLTVTIGMVRAVKGLMWLGMILLCRRVNVKIQEVSA